jgi:prolyl-tRNA synthetase
MKDAYSFDVEENGLNENYEKMLKAYQDIFSECGLNFLTAEADPGAMGGNVSHEFMVPAQIGEDILCYCEKCAKYFKPNEKCPECKSALIEKKMIEVGHIFKLGTKYSLAQQALFLDKDGVRKPIIMGCYGIGVSRILAAVIEVSHDEKGIIWPKTITPFDISLLSLDERLNTTALELCTTLENAGFEVLVDDRVEAAGVKFNDAYLLGNPCIAIIGKNFSSSGKIDLEIRRSRQKMSFTVEELLNFLQREYA